MAAEDPLQRDELGGRELRWAWHRLCAVAGLWAHQHLFPGTRQEWAQERLVYRGYIALLSRDRDGEALTAKQRQQFEGLGEQECIRSIRLDPMLGALWALDGTTLEDFDDESLHLAGSDAVRTEPADL